MSKTTIYFLIRIIFVILYIIITVKEIINIKKHDKKTVLPGLFLIFSMWGTLIPIITNLFIDLFSIFWLLIINFMKKKNVEIKSFGYYIIPALIIILSYILSLFYLYKDQETYAIYFASQIIMVILVFSLISCVLYILTYIKFVYFKIKYKKSFKEVFKENKTTITFPFIMLALFPLILI